MEPTVSCAECDLLLRGDEGARCRKRDFAIPEPTQTFCANHTLLEDGPYKCPIGPVLLTNESGPRILAHAPDSHEVRAQLLSIAARTEAATAQDLSLVEATALWQLRQLGERRAFVHLDRIDGTIDLPGGLSTNSTPSLALANRKPTEFRSTRVHARIVAALLLAHVVTSAFAGFAHYRVFRLLDGSASDPHPRTRVEQLDGVMSAWIILLAVTGVTFLVWLYRAYRNLFALPDARPWYSPGRAVGCWFIPVINLILPCLVVRDAWRSSKPADRTGEWLVSLWWIAWIAAGGLAAWQRGYLTGSARPDIEALLRAEALTYAYLGATALAATLQILVIFGITRRQGDGTGVGEIFE